MISAPAFSEPWHERAVVVVGLGQLGALFAGAWLALGRPVVPWLRSSEAEDFAELRPAATLLAMGEAALPEVLARLPEALAEGAVLVQNELLPHAWVGQKSSPTVCVVWFEKKGAKPPHSILPSVLHGPKAGLVAEALTWLGLPYQVAPDEAARDQALVVKNLYILLLNLAGLRVGGTAGELLTKQPELAQSLLAELVQHQAALLGRELDLASLTQEVRRAIDADPSHGCRGRSAEERLTRVLAQAREKGLSLPLVEALAREHLSGDGTER